MIDMVESPTIVSIDHINLLTSIHVICDEIIYQSQIGYSRSIL